LEEEMMKVPWFVAAPATTLTKTLKRRTVLLVLALLLVPTLSHADWKVKTLAKGGAYNSIAVDSSGNPHISYLDDSNPMNYVLRHASLNGKAWRHEIVDSGDVGWWNAIAVDSLGHIHISYLSDKPTASLRYAYFDGSGWSVTSVDSSGGYSTSIAVDADNRPHISYVDFSGNLKYATPDGTTWVVQAIPDVSASWDGLTSIAVGPSGAINIAFSTGSRQVQWATKTSGSWEVRPVGEGIQPSLALDRSGNPHIVFNSEATGDIFYSRYNGNDWLNENLTEFEGEGAGEKPAIALDSLDRPHVTIGVYVPVGEGGVETLIYGRFDGVAWGYELVDFKNSGFQSSIALDPWDLPHVSYRQARGERSNLKYANSGITPPQIATKSLKAGKLGKNYKVKLKAKDGTKPYLWELSSGSLPSGLSLDPAGVISGIPAETGEFVFELNVSDALGLARKASFTLVVQ
jgi:hypothetical protein